MAMKENVYRLYPNLGYWLMLFIPLVFTGFYFTYFTKLDFSPTMIHAHFILMGIWMGMMIIQPLLIRYRQVRLHRNLGRLSYFLVPVLILVTYWVLKNGYATQITSLESDLAQGIAPYTEAEGRIVIAAYHALAFTYIFWLIVFYGLAIAFRKQSSIHARFMIAAALTFMGPTLDRTLFFWFGLETLGFGIPVETLAFVINDLIILILLLQDFRKGKKSWPLLISLGLYLTVQIGYFTLTKTPAWEQFVNFILN